MMEQRLKDKIASLQKAGGVLNGQLAGEMEEVLSGEQRFISEDGGVYVSDEVRGRLMYNNQLGDYRSEFVTSDTAVPVSPIYTVCREDDEEEEPSEDPTDALCRHYKVGNEDELAILDQLAGDACADLGVEPTDSSPISGVNMRDYLADRICEFSILQNAASKFVFLSALSNGKG